MKHALMVSRATMRLLAAACTATSACCRASSSFILEHNARPIRSALVLCTTWRERRYYRVSLKRQRE